MRSGRLGLWVVPVIAASVLATACGDDPPTREIQQAQTALDSARSAGADDYAHDEFVAAGKALQGARDAVGQRDYRLALTNALDSRERAQAAAKETVDQKAIARTRVQRLLTDVSASLGRAKGRLKTAEASKGPARGLTAPRLALEETEQHVQEARTAFEKADYRTAQKALEAATASLAGAGRDLDTPVAGPTKRRR